MRTDQQKIAKIVLRITLNQIWNMIQKAAMENDTAQLSICSFEKCAYRKSTYESDRFKTSLEDELSTSNVEI